MPLGRSININVVPSFGHIVNVAESDKNKLVTPPPCSSARSNSGDSKRAPFTSGPRTSTHPDTRRSVSARSWRSQSTRSTSTSMLNVRGSAEGSDSDPSPIPYHHHNYPQHQMNRFSNSCTAYSYRLPMFNCGFAQKILYLLPRRYPAKELHF